MSKASRMPWAARPSCSFQSAEGIFRRSPLPWPRAFKKLREKAGDKNLNVILCENYYQPAKWLRGMVDDLLPASDREWFRTHIGIAEALVLRSCIEPTEEMRRKDR